MRNHGYRFLVRLDFHRNDTGLCFFLLQILLDYNRNREQIQPQMHQIEEILKVQRLIEEANSEGAVLDGELEKLDKKHKELEAALKVFDEKEKD